MSDTILLNTLPSREEFVSIINDTPDEIETDVDFETITALANLLEEDDGPELA